MSRGIVKVLKANGVVILETVITDSLRIQVPSNLKPLFNTPERVRVTIEKVNS
jgi:hypothetical protein